MPVVLSADEVAGFLQAVKGTRNRVALMTTCAAARLQVTDIDSSRMIIRIEQGKGGKDRYVLPSPQLLEILRVYWRLTKPGRWLFPRRDGRGPIR